MDNRHSRPTLTGTRIYEKRGWLQYRAPTPLLDRKSGKLKQWHKLCPVGPGDEFRARALLHDLLNHAPVGYGDFPVVFQSWRNEVFADRASIAPKSPEKLVIWLAGNKSLDSMFNVIADAFRDTNVADLRPTHIHQFLKQWDGRRAAQAYRGHLAKFFTWSCREGYRESNPATAEVVPVKVPPKREVRITGDQFAQLRDEVNVKTKLGKPTASGQMVQCYVDLTYLLYQRTTDVRLLRWGDVDEANDCIAIEPTKTARSSGVSVTIPLSPAIKEVLARAKAIRRRDSMFVIHDRNGQVYSASGLRSAWNRACERLGIVGVTLKDIRAMAASDARAKGYSKREISTALSHKKEATTDGYLRDKEVFNSAVVLDLPTRSNRDSK